MSRCLLDIVIAVDLSGSTKGPGSGPGANYPNLPQLDWNQNYFGHANLPYEAERVVLEGLIDYFTPRMLAQEVQVGVVFWGAVAVPLEVGGPGSGIWMTTDPYGVLSTAKTVQAPDGQMHSPIAYEMWRHFAAKEPGSGPNPTAGQIYNAGVGTWTKLHTAIDACFSHGSAKHGNITINSTHWSHWNWDTMNTLMTYNSPNSDGVGILQLTAQSDLAGDYPARENDPTYRKVGLIITDSGNTPAASGIYMWPHQQTVLHQGNLPYVWPTHTPSTSNGQNATGGCTYQSNSLSPITSSGPHPGPWNLGGDSNQYIMGAVVLTGAFLSQPTTGMFSQNNIKETLDCITCNHNGGNEPWNTSTAGENFGFYVDATNPAAITNFAASVVGPACGIQPSWNCSGANGVTVGNVSYSPWTCYDPGTGLGAWGPNATIHPNSTYTDCLNACAQGSGVSYNCSGSSNVTVSGVTYPHWTCYDPGNGTGTYDNPDPVIALANCQNNCIPPVTLYSCSMAGGATDPVTGAVIPPWTCYVDPNGTMTQNQCDLICDPLPSWNCHMDYHTGIGTCIDPQDGSGQYTVKQQCIDDCIERQYVGPELPTGGFKSWDCVTNWKPTFAGGGLSYNCVGLNNTSGQYTTKQDCLDVCHAQQYTDPPFLTGSTWKCHIPWQQIVGICTEIPNSIGTANAGPYTTEQDCLDACKAHTVDPGFPIIEGWNCVQDVTGAFNCDGPVMGGAYPTEAACLQTCGTVSVGVACAGALDVYLCPCGWDYWEQGTGPAPGSLWTYGYCTSPDWPQNIGTIHQGNIHTAVPVSCVTIDGLPPLVGQAVWQTYDPITEANLYAQYPLGSPPLSSYLGTIGTQLPTYGYGAVPSTGAIGAANNNYITWNTSYVAKVMAPSGNLPKDFTEVSCNTQFSHTP